MQLSPIFHKRIKKLFELKYENLNLEYDEYASILYGTYQKNNISYNVLVSCIADVSYQKITRAEIIDISTINQDYFRSSPDAQPKFYILLENGEFDEKDNSNYLFTEAEFILKELIDFKPYLKQLIGNFENKALPLSEKGRKLHDVFIEPSYNNGKENLKEYINEWLKSQNYKRHLVVLANGGMGKTSFMEFYAYLIAKQLLKDMQQVERIPIFISLKNIFPKGYSKDIFHKFRDFAKNKLNYALFEILLEKGKFILILDGFDEMNFLKPKNERLEEFRNLLDLGKAGNKVMISVRSNYFGSEYELNSVINQYATQKIILDFFNKNKIKLFIENYYEEKDKKIRYFKLIQENPSILELCKRPVFLHLVLERLPTLILSNNKRLNSTELLKEHIHSWIEQQTDNKNIDSKLKNIIKTRTERIIWFHNFFVDLASQYYNEHQGIILSKEEVKSVLELQLKKKNYYQTTENDIENILHEVTTFGIIEQTDSEYHFVHKLFYEYFVSRKIVNLLGFKDGGKDSDSKKLNLQHKLILQEWSREIMDFLYSAEELKNVKIEAEKTNLPLLLYLTNNKWIAKIKLILFKWWAKFWYSTTSHILGILALMIAIILIVIITQIPFVQANVSKSPFFIPSGMILGASLGGVLPLFRKYGCKILQEQSILKKMLAALSFLGVFVFSFIMFSLTYIAFFFARSTSLLWLSLFILFLCLSIFFGQGLMQSLLISLDVDTTNKVNFRFGKKTLVTKAIYMAFLKQKSFTINIRFDSFFLLESLYGYSIAFHENLHLSRPLNLYTFQEQKIIDSSFKLLGLKFINCELENIKLSGRVMQIHFEKTSFRNVDFSKLNILIKPPFRLVLKDISPEKIDAYSLQSLRQFVKKHELKVSLKVRKQQEKSSSLIEGIKKYYFKTSQQVLADDWLLKKLEEDLK